MKNLIIVITIWVVFVSVVKSQVVAEVVSYSDVDTGCSMYKGLYPGQTLDVLGINPKKLRTTDSIVVNNSLTLYVFKGIIWRIKHTGVRLPCAYEKIYMPGTQYNGIQRYVSNDITVVYDGDATYVTDTHLWMRVIRQQ